MTRWWCLLPVSLLGPGASRGHATASAANGHYYNRISEDRLCFRLSVCRLYLGHPEWLVWPMLPATRSNSLACRPLHSDTFTFSGSTAGWAWGKLAALDTTRFSGRPGAGWQLHFSGEVWCDVCASTPLGECVPGATATEGAWQSENCSVHSRNGLRCSMYV